MAVADQAQALRQETEHRTLHKRRDIALDQLTRINRVIPRPKYPSNLPCPYAVCGNSGVLASGHGV